MKPITSLFRFCTIKIARLKEYKQPALDPNIKDNLIWMHGMFDSSKNFLNLTQHENLRKITNQTLIDCRNHGYSQHTDTHTYPDMAYDLVEYIANRNMKDIFLIGHSMGGRTILSAMHDHHAFLKERVKGVIIVDVLPSSYAVAGSGPIDQMHRLLEEMKSIQIIDRTYAEVEKEVKAKFQEAIAANILSNLDQLSTGQLRWCVNIDAILGSFDGLMEYEVKDTLWQGPRLIIFGGKSKFTSLERVSNTYSSIFTDLNMKRDVIEYRESGHFVYVKEPERFINEIVTFIQRVNDENNSQAKKQQRFLDEALTFDI